MNMMYGNIDATSQMMGGPSSASASARGSSDQSPHMTPNSPFIQFFGHHGLDAIDLNDDGVKVQYGSHSIGDGMKMSC